MSTDDKPPAQANEADRGGEAELDAVRSQLAEAEAALDRERGQTGALRKERDELEARCQQIEQARDAAAAERDEARREVGALETEAARIQDALDKEVEAHAAKSSALAEEQSAKQLLEIECDGLQQRLAETEESLGGAERARRAAETDANTQRGARNFFIATTVAGAASHLLRKK